MMKPRKLKRAIIKEEYLAITGNMVTAIILNQLLYWSDRVKDAANMIAEENQRLEKGEQLTIGVEFSHGWLYKTAESLRDELMLPQSRQTIRRAMGKLRTLGIVHERNNPAHKWDKTKQYRIDYVRLHQLLAQQGFTLEGYTNGRQIMFEQPSDEHSIVQNGQSNNQNGRSNNQNGRSNNQNGRSKDRGGRAIPETTTEITTETTTEQDRIGEPIRSYSGDTEKEIENRKPASPGTAEADRETTRAVIDLLNDEGVIVDILQDSGYSEKLKIGLPRALDEHGKANSDFQMTPDSRKAVSIIRDELTARKLPADARHISAVVVQAYLDEGRGHRMVEYIVNQQSGLTLRPFVAWDGFIDEVFASFKDKVTELCKELYPPDEGVNVTAKGDNVPRAAEGNVVEAQPIQTNHSTLAALPGASQSL